MTKTIEQTKIEKIESLIWQKRGQIMGEEGKPWGMKVDREYISRLQDEISELEKEKKALTA